MKLRRLTLEEGGEAGVVDILCYRIHNLDQELCVGGVSEGREREGEMLRRVGVRFGHSRRSKSVRGFSQSCQSEKGGKGRASVMIVEGGGGVCGMCIVEEVLAMMLGAGIGATWSRRR